MKLNCHYKTTSLQNKLGLSVLLYSSPALFQNQYVENSEWQERPIKMSVFIVGAGVCYMTLRIIK
jgi:hypothetical protein